MEEVEENPEFVPHMLAQLEDELARSRKREAFWISVVVHIVLVLLVVFSPQWMPDWAQPHLLRAEDLARTKEPTYLALPQDLQKPPPKVHTDKLSDKNRIAQTTHPQNRQQDPGTAARGRLRGNQMPPGAPAARPQMPQRSSRNSHHRAFQRAIGDEQLSAAESAAAGAANGESVQDSGSAGDSHRTGHPQHAHGHHRRRQRLWHGTSDRNAAWGRLIS